MDERVDAPAQLDDFALEQIDRLDLGPVAGRERHFLDGVDVGRHQVGDVEVVVHHGIGDGVHHREWAQPHLLGVGIHPLAHVGQPTVLAVPDCHHEIAVDEDHDLAGLDDLAGQHQRLVRNVVDRLENQEQRLVVTLQLRPLVGLYGVLDGQRVQAENVADFLHLVLGGLVQADPGEGFLAGQLQLTHLGPGLCVGESPGQSHRRPHRYRSRPPPARRAGHPRCG